MKQHRPCHRSRQAAVAAIAILSLAACSSEQSEQGSGATNDPITPSSLDAASLSPVQLVDVATGTALTADSSVIVVDVRTPAEYAEGHLARAELVDFTAPDFRDQIAQLDRSATYFVYCHSGNRSAQATATMAELGFLNVYELDGGIAAWQDAGGPVIT
jgi:phage shock protein E